MVDGEVWEGGLIEQLTPGRGDRNLPHAQDLSVILKAIQTQPLRQDYVPWCTTLFRDDNAVLQRADHLRASPTERFYRKKSPLSSIKHDWCHGKAANASETSKLQLSLAEE